MSERIKRVLHDCFHPAEGKPNLREVVPNIDRAKEYLEKARSNLRAMELMFNQDLF